MFCYIVSFEELRKYIRTIESSVLGLSICSLDLSAEVAVNSSPMSLFQSAFLSFFSCHANSN